MRPGFRSTYSAVLVPPVFGWMGIEYVSILLLNLYQQNRNAIDLKNNQEWGKAMVGRISTRVRWCRGRRCDGDAATSGETVGRSRIRDGRESNCRQYKCGHDWCHEGVKTGDPVCGDWRWCVSCAYPGNLPWYDHRGSIMIGRALQPIEAVVRASA